MPVNPASCGGQGSRKNWRLGYVQTRDESWTVIDLGHFDDEGELLMAADDRLAGGPAKPGRLALCDQSARFVTCSPPDLRPCPSERVTISLTSFIAQFDRFPRMLLAL